MLHRALDVKKSDLEKPRSYRLWESETHDGRKHTFLIIGSRQLVRFNASKGSTLPRRFLAVLAAALKRYAWRRVQGEGMDTTDIDWAAIRSQSENLEAPKGELCGGKSVVELLWGKRPLANDGVSKAKGLRSKETVQNEERRQR